MTSVRSKPVKVNEPTDGSNKWAPWSTILFNCNCHSFEEVARQLMKAIHVNYEGAMRFAEEVHSTGRAVVYSGHRERCEAVAMILEDIRLRVKVSR